MANIYDVARHAGVSVATVSAVINESAYVSPNLKSRVRDAIEALEYKPNLLARSLAKQQSRLLGMVVPDIANPFWPDVVRGAEDAAHGAGYTLLLSNSDDEPEKENLYLNLFLANRVDAILLAKAPGRLKPDVMAQIRRGRTAVVQLLRSTPGLRSDSVTMDDRAAGYAAVAHLLRLGYRRVALVSGPRRVTTASARHEGCLEALQEWNLEPDPELVYEGDFRGRSGYEAGMALLRRKPQAVFVANYLMAVGFMKALRQHRLQCPRDVAIVTCDDYPWMDSFSPTLTTVNFPKYELGTAAARLAIERLSSAGGAPQRIELKSALCIRESCGQHLVAAT